MTGGGSGGGAVPGALARRGPGGAGRGPAQGPRRGRVDRLERPADHPQDHRRGAITGRSRSSPRRRTRASTCWPRSSPSTRCARRTSPPTLDHPYGHEKVENLAAAIEGVLILLGAAMIIFESVRRISQGTPGGVDRGRHRGHRASPRWPTWWCRASSTGAPRPPTRRPWRATPRTCGRTRSPRVGVLVGLALVEITGVQAFDPTTAMLVAGAIVYVRAAASSARSSRVLVDEALPAGRARRGARGDRGARRGRGGAASTSCARGRAGSRRYVDLHVQFRGRDHALAGPRDQPRAAAGDPRTAARRRRAHPPGARRAVHSGDRVRSG